MRRRTFLINRHAELRDVPVISEAEDHILSAITAVGVICVCSAIVVIGAIGTIWTVTIGTGTPGVDFVAIVLVIYGVLSTVFLLWSLSPTLLYHDRVSGIAREKRQKEIEDIDRRLHTYQ
jgi:hypothetical protein